MLGQGEGCLQAIFGEAAILSGRGQLLQGVCSWLVCPPAQQDGHGEGLQAVLTAALQPAQAAHQKPLLSWQNEACED